MSRIKDGDHVVLFSPHVDRHIDVEEDVARARYKDVSGSWQQLSIVKTAGAAGPTVRFGDTIQLRVDHRPSKTWLGPAQIFTVGEAHKPHRCMLRRTASRLTKHGWSPRKGCTFKAFASPQPGTVAFAVGETHNPHRCMIEQTSRRADGNGWKHLLFFHAYTTPQPGTVAFAVGEARKPHRCMIAQQNKPKNTQGWSHKLHFYAFPRAYNMSTLAFPLRLECAGRRVGDAVRDGDRVALKIPDTHGGGFGGFGFGVPRVQGRHLHVDDAAELGAGFDDVGSKWQAFRIQLRPAPASVKAAGAGAGAGAAVPPPAPPALTVPVSDGSLKQKLNLAMSNTGKAVLSAATQPTPTVEDVDARDPRCRETLAKMRSTMGPGTIVRSIRVVAGGLGEAVYAMTKLRMDKRNDGVGANEQLLFHGTDADTAKKILANGFNRSFCGRNGTAYGDGVYFARDASYSAADTYARPDRSRGGIKTMFLCKVLVGRVTKGRSGMRTPPLLPKWEANLYRHAKAQGAVAPHDAMVDRLVDPSIIVSGHNDATVFPKLIIEFFMPHRTGWQPGPRGPKRPAGPLRGGDYVSLRCVSSGRHVDVEGRKKPAPGGGGAKGSGSHVARTRWKDAKGKWQRFRLATGAGAGAGAASATLKSRADAFLEAHTGNFLAVQSTGHAVRALYPHKKGWETLRFHAVYRERAGAEIWPGDVVVVEAAKTGTLLQAHSKDKPVDASSKRVTEKHHFILDLHPHPVHPWGRKK